MACEKINDTVRNLMRHPVLHARYRDIPLAAAHELCDHASLRLIRAHGRMNEVDPDNDVMWHEAADELVSAESDFLRLHGKTEVTL